MLEQIYEIAAEPAAGVQYSHTRRDVPTKELVEQVNVDLAKLLA